MSIQRKGEREEEKLMEWVRGKSKRKDKKGSLRERERKGKRKAKKKKLEEGK